MAEIVALHRNDRPAPPEPSTSPRNGPEPLWRHLLGDQLRRRRHDRGETLTETAEKAGVSPQYLSEMERGIKEPSSEMIAAVAGALEITLVELTSAVAQELGSAAAPASAAVSGAGRSAFALAA